MSLVDHLHDVHDKALRQATLHDKFIEVERAGRWRRYQCQHCSVVVNVEDGLLQLRSR